MNTTSLPAAQVAKHIADLIKGDPLAAQQVHEHFGGRKELRDALNISNVEKIYVNTPPFNMAAAVAHFGTAEVLKYVAANYPKQLIYFYADRHENTAGH